MNEDDFWRRPSDDNVPVAETVPTSPYLGPPQEVAPPHKWRPELMLTRPIPRRLPVVDHDAIDDEEAQAQRFTYGVGMASSAVVLLLAAGKLLT